VVTESKLPANDSGRVKSTILATEIKEEAVPLMLGDQSGPAVSRRSEKLPQ